MLENQKLVKIIEEFSLYLLEQDISLLDVQIKKMDNKVFFTFVCDKIEEDKINELVKIFKHKRQTMFEVYGWELIGQGLNDNELELVSNLVNMFTYYYLDGKVIFNLVRYE